MRAPSWRGHGEVDMEMVVGLLLVTVCALGWIAMRLGEIASEVRQLRQLKELEHNAAIVDRSMA